MVTRLLRAAVCTLLALALTAGLLLPGCGGPSRPNVIVIVVDTLRADRLHCYGNPRDTSPALDRFGAEGVVFDNAMSQGAETVTSVPLLLTGRRPGEPGMEWKEVMDLRFAVPQKQTPTLAQSLKERGYRTALFSATPVLGMNIDASPGFDTYDLSIGDGPVWLTSTSEDLNTRALKWLDQHGGGSHPFFMYLQYLDPHSQYRPPSAYCRYGRPGYTARDNDRNDRLSGSSAETELPGEGRERAAAHALSPRDVARLSDLYDGEVRCTDESLGRLFAKLKQRGLYDNTLIVVTADHGDAFLEHGDLQHGRSLYQELVHVPLLVRGPGVKGGRHVTHVVENASLAPTVLEAVGAGASPRSLYPALTSGEEPTSDIGMSEVPATGVYALREGPLKLITSRRGTELYDLRTDPGERHNLAATRPKEVTRLQAMLKERLDARVAGKTTTGKLTEKQRKVMKSLGYLK